MPYYWLAGAERRLPASAVGVNLELLGIYARTRTGRPLVVTVRHGEGFTWWIPGARDMTDDELAAFEAWEETR